MRGCRSRWPWWRPEPRRTRGFRLATLAGELREAGSGLEGFADADLATDVRTVFSWSYQQLSPPAATLFRLLGLHPGPDIAWPAAASLAGLPVGGVRPVLAELARMHLVVEHVPGRYTCHDLLRAYAAEQAGLLDTDAERRAAAHRVLGHYLHTAYAADRLLNPVRDDPTTLSALPAGVSPEPLADRAQAWAWFGAERAVLLATIRRNAGFDLQTWQLAWTLQRCLSYQGLWHDSIGALSAALDAARRLADPIRQAYAHRFLGCAYLRSGRDDDAHRHLHEALDLYHGAEDSVGEALAHRHYAWMLDRRERPSDALGHAEQALDLFRAAGHRAGEGRALNAVGWFHARLGDHGQALDYCQRALNVQDEIGDRLSQAETWDSLGYLYHQLRSHDRAAACYQAAIDLYREFEDRFNEADKLVSLGDVHQAAGDLPSASRAWRRAADRLDQLGDPKAGAVRTRLRRLADGAGPPLVPD